MPERKPPLAGLSRRRSRLQNITGSPWWSDYMQNRKLRTILGLVLVYIATIFNLQWVWGVIFLLWVVPDIFSGVTFFIEPISKLDNPILYWVIIVTWLWMSVFMLSTFFIDYNKYF